MVVVDENGNCPISKVQKNFICDHCYGAFRSGYHLKRHILIHTGMCPNHNGLLLEVFHYQLGTCLTCLANTVRKYIRPAETPVWIKWPVILILWDGLQKRDCLVSDFHSVFGVLCGDLSLKLVLFGLGEKPYACGICDMRFIQRYHLERHSLIHTGMRPLTVPISH